MSAATPLVETHTWPGASHVPILADRYQLLGIVGQGGMGTVFKGYHTVLKRDVAIKTLRVDRQAGTGSIDRFLREMEVIGRLDHPNVVRATDAGQQDEILHLVMEYLTGADLSRVVAHTGPLGLGDACELARQAALGLDYIHNRKLVHRDIKPSNLMLTAGGVVKILDLGLARFHGLQTGDKTPEGCILGTLNYLAPEQANGSAVDGRTDIYALGCTLFYLVTGQPPFDAPRFATGHRKLYAHAQVPLFEADSFSAVPVELQTILLRMAAKSPEERYPTAAEAASALERFAATGRAVDLHGRVSGGMEPILRPITRALAEEIGLKVGPAFAAQETVTTAAPQPRVRWRPWAAWAGLAACTMLGLIVAATGRLGPGTAATLPEPPPPKPTTSEHRPAGAMRNLDELAVGRSHKLLDVPPLVVGRDPNNPRSSWRWSDGLYQAEVRGPNPILLILGTTAVKSYSIEAGIDQTPWTGEAGIFWGYREDAAAKEQQVPNKEFAWFQMVCIQKETGPNGLDTFYADRGTGSLKYNVRGEVWHGTYFRTRHEIPRPVGEQILRLEVRRNRLVAARIGTNELPGIYNDLANDRARDDPYQGGLGVCGLSHTATFGNIRFAAFQAE